MVAVSQSGELRWTMLPGKGGEYQAQLRRAQALAPFTGTGLEIGRWLVARKIEGQRDVLRDLAAKATVPLLGAWSRKDVPGAVLALERTLPGVQKADTIPTLRAVEAEAAAIHWSALTDLPLHFAPPSYARTIPNHWRSFAGRGSPLTEGPRNAVDPTNCLLSYGYALAGAEALTAAHAAGLDPYFGILHTDTDSRRSLVWDLVEPIRPIVDRLVLNLIMTHAFRPGELHLLRDGRCRLDQDLCARLWEWMPEMRRMLGPVMPFVVSQLRHGPRYGERKAYRLIEVATEIKTRAPLGRKRWAREAMPPALQSVNACRACGVLLDNILGRLYCDECLPDYRIEQTRALRARHHRTLAQRREAGNDPAHGGTAARKRGRKISAHEKAAAVWNRTHPPADPARFQREILPSLISVPLVQLARATGLSVPYCARVRQGKAIPHARWWEALRAIGQKNGCQTSTS